MILPLIPNKKIQTDDPPIQTCFSATSPHIMSQTRRILMPIKTPEEIKSPRNALQEAIDRALRPEKSPLQMRADEYYEKALASTYGVKRYEHLDDGLIMFTYSDFSITKIRELVGGSFKVELYQTTRCKNDSDTRGRTFADEFNELWAGESNSQKIADTKMNPYEKRAKQLLNRS